MVNHVKLEIAIQICAENIADIQNKLNATNDENLRHSLEIELANAFDEKEKVASGDLTVINKLLTERGNK